MPSNPTDILPDQVSGSSRPPLRSILPPLILGTATFNHQYNLDPFALNTSALVAEAITCHGIRAFDTSPYYGPAESLLGEALSQDAITSKYPRSSYCILTKAGRISEDEFDYTPDSICASVRRSLKRLKTTYLDVVYCHDVEFVEPHEVVAAVKELRRLRDSEEDGHPVRYIGISGYPLDTLRSLAALILTETGEPIDIIQSYAQFTLQNTKLAERALLVAFSALDCSGNTGFGTEVGPVVANASPLGMGLLRTVGVPVGAKGDFHPAPRGLRDAVARASEHVRNQLLQEGQQQGQQWTKDARLEDIAIRFSLEEWLRSGAQVGCRITLRALSQEITSSSSSSSDSLRRLLVEREDSNTKTVKLGVNVIGVSNIDELSKTMTVWRSSLSALGLNGDEITSYVTSGNVMAGEAEKGDGGISKDGKGLKMLDSSRKTQEGKDSWEAERQESIQRRELTLRLAHEIREEVLGLKWFGYSWESPPRRS